MPNQSLTRPWPARIAVSIGLAALLTACQGNFDAPRLDHPNDPNTNSLPPTPRILRVQVDRPDSCSASGPRMLVVWEVSSEAGVVEFQLYRTDVAGDDPGELIAHIPADVTRFVDQTGLQQNRRYHYRVRTQGTGGQVSFRSAERNSTTTRCP